VISTEKPGTPAELVHFGVKGMKWGVRRDREVSPGRQAKREAKAQKFVQKSADLQKQIKTLQTKKSDQNFIRKTFTEDKIAALQRKQAQAEKDAEAKRQGKLSRKQKQVVVGAAVVGTLVAAGVLSYTLNSGQARVFMNRGQEAITRKKFRFDENPDFKTPDLTPKALNDVVARGINPGYSSGAIGSSMNCRRCTFAYEMRRRGYNVEATRTQKGTGQTAFGLYNVLNPGRENVTRGGFISRIIRKGPHDPVVRRFQTISQRAGSLRPIDEPHQIFSELAKQPNRSRGELGVEWLFGGGHSMAYEIVDGVPHILDTQTGHIFSSLEQLQAERPHIKSAGFTRLDNLPLDTNFLQRWVKNA
jgi:hypothetical protein